MTTKRQILNFKDFINILVHYDINIYCYTVHFQKKKGKENPEQPDMYVCFWLLQQMKYFKD